MSGGVGGNQEVLVKIISLTFNSALGGFDDSELRGFITGKEVISIRDHLFIRNEIPYLVLIVKYFPHRTEADAASPVPRKQEEPWKQALSEADLGCFNQLRDWRMERSKKEGVAPYILFTNKQLVDIVKMKPQALSDLAKIQGVGSGKVEKYGQEVLKFFIAMKTEEVPSKKEDDGQKSGS